MLKMRVRARVHMQKSSSLLFSSSCCLCSLQATLGGRDPVRTGVRQLPGHDTTGGIALGRDARANVGRCHEAVVAVASRTGFANDNLRDRNAGRDDLVDGCAREEVRALVVETGAVLVVAGALCTTSTPVPQAPHDNNERTYLVVELDVVEVDEIANLLVDLEVRAVRVVGGSREVRRLGSVRDDILRRGQRRAEGLGQGDQEVLAAAGRGLEGAGVLVVNLQAALSK